MKKRYILFLLLIYFLTPHVITKAAADYKKFYEDMQMEMEANNWSHFTCSYSSGDNEGMHPSLKSFIFKINDTGIFVKYENRQTGSWLSDQYIYNSKTGTIITETKVADYELPIHWDSLRTDLFYDAIARMDACPDTIVMADTGTHFNVEYNEEDNATYDFYFNLIGSEFVTTSPIPGDGTGNTQNSCRNPNARSCSEVCYKEIEDKNIKIYFEIGIQNNGTKYLSISDNYELSNRQTANETNGEIITMYKDKSYNIIPDAIQSLFLENDKYLSCDEMKLGHTMIGTTTNIWIGTEDTIFGDYKEDVETPPEEDLNDNDDGDGKKYDELSCKGLWGDPDNPNEPAYWVQWALDLIKYLAIIALLVFSTIDFVKAFVSQDREAINHALTTAAKRAIFAVMIFFLPILIEFIMTLFGAYGTCGFE